MIQIFSKRIYIVLSVLLFGCGSLERKPISKVEDYHKELKAFTADSNNRMDTLLINTEYLKNDMPSLVKNNLKEISQEIEFKELLKTEKNILTKWEAIKNFKSYFETTPPDTLFKIIRRCSAFDRAPLNAERLPSARGMRAVSFDYYKFEVPVAFHIIKNAKGEGQLSNLNEKIDAQIRLLNSVYNRFNISFKLVSVDITVNDEWFNKASYYIDKNALQNMTSKLSKNPEAKMNVYTIGFPNPIGEATYPWYPEKGTSGDYVVINYNTLPGGPDKFEKGKYNEGKTLVHETGHFLGLLHTFEGGDYTCNSAPPQDGCTIGDQVDDTPSQLICYFDGCDENTDSCPEPGKDPVRNFMGYNPDACMNQITRGQGDRLLTSIIKYRYYLVTNSPRP
jgi:predicted Zn-dependent protease